MEFRAMETKLKKLTLSQETLRNLTELDKTDFVPETRTCPNRTICMTCEVCFGADVAG